MKTSRMILVLTALLAAHALYAYDDAAVKKFMSEFLTPCSKPAKFTHEHVDMKLPTGMTASILRVQSDDPWCAAGYLDVRTPDRIFLGYPWPLDANAGPIEKRIEKYAWSQLKQTVKADVTRKENPEGLYPVHVWEVTDSGNIPLEGLVDPKGMMFFPGPFFDPTKDPAIQRLSMLAPVLAKAPARGNLQSKVQIIEFSDFECPSCRHASEPIMKLMDKYGDRVGYHRVDFPLFMNHPWALPAALMGRAIWHQNHGDFWQFKKTIYENQEKLNNFNLADFARNFAEDHQLDLKRYDADIASDSVKDEIFAGVGLGIELQVHATPTVWLNGHPVQIGDDAKVLEKAINDALAKAK